MMSSSNFGAGQSEYTGEYKKVRAAGSVKVFDCNIEDLFMSGDVNITNSNITKARVIGCVNAEKVVFDQGDILGHFTSTGICKAQIMHIAGVLNAEYFDAQILTDSKHFKNDKNATTVWSGNIKATTFESYHNFKVGPDCNFKNIVNMNKILSGDKIYCNNLISFSSIVTDLINADTIYITAVAGTKIKQIEGEYVWIGRQLPRHERITNIPKTLNSLIMSKIRKIKKIEVDTIEADVIDIDYVKAIKICGEIVNVGDNCNIDYIEYSKELNLSKKAIVKSVVKL